MANCKHSFTHKPGYPEAGVFCQACGAKPSRNQLIAYMRKNRARRPKG